jgi:hypothetical protein
VFADVSKNKLAAEVEEILTEAGAEVRDPVCLSAKISRFRDMPELAAHNRVEDVVSQIETP